MREFLDKQVIEGLGYVPGSVGSFLGTFEALTLVLQHPGPPGSAPGRALVGSAIEWHAGGSQPIALALFTERSKLQDFYWISGLPSLEVK